MESPLNQTVKQSERPTAPEPEHVGPIWKHPYMLYVILTFVLFCVMGVIAYFAKVNGWIPQRPV